MTPRAFLLIGLLAAFGLGCSADSDSDVFGPGEGGSSGDGGGAQQGGSGGSGGKNTGGSAQGGQGGAGQGGKNQGGSSGTGGTSQGGSSGTGGVGEGGTAQGGTGGTGEGGSGGTGGSPVCYSEVYHPGESISDLKSAYNGSNWLNTALGILERRYPTGFFVLDAMKNDSQLPGFVDTSSWSDFAMSIDTMVHEESHGWDFENSQYPGHSFVLRDDLQLSVPAVDTWPRSDILDYITDNSTEMYDDVYLKGTQGTYDAIFLMDEMNAYANGLATLTSIHQEIPPSISSRDGNAAQTLYLQFYLRAGRLTHVQQYNALKANAQWQKLIRYEWARANFWEKEAKPYKNLTIHSDAIWAHIEESANLEEIKLFTGEDAATVACSP